MIDQSQTCNTPAEIQNCGHCAWLAKAYPDYRLTCIDDDGKHTHDIDCHGCGECDACEFDCYSEGLDPGCDLHNNRL